MAQSYRLTAQADQDVADIVRYSLTTFGETQTRSYIVGLRDSFERLARSPSIGVMQGDIRPDLRRYRFKSHYVFYSETGHGVLIEAVVHTAREIRSSTLGN